MKNKKGFTLVELLAVIIVLGIVAGISIFIGVSVINNAKEKTYVATKNNIENTVSSYVIENSDNLFYNTLDDDSEYQCITIQELIDSGYFNNDVLKSEYEENKLVDKDKKVYIERDRNSKSINEITFLTGNETEDKYKTCNSKTISNIRFKVTNTDDAKKEVEITYNIINPTEEEYTYVYQIGDNDKITTPITNEFKYTTSIIINNNTTIYAWIEGIDNSKVSYEVKFATSDITISNKNNEIEIIYNIIDEENDVIYKNLYKIDDGEYQEYTGKFTIDNDAKICAKVDKIDNEVCENVKIKKAITITFDANGGTIDTKEYTYTGGEQKFTASKDGYYQLETWGAQGGLGYGKYIGGYGGYATGVVYLNKGDILYINIGGKGDDGVKTKNTETAGGYNGGGAGYNYTSKSRYVGGGGGATHIATKTGLLSELYDDIDSILIVSGGGGGGAYYNSSYHSTIGTGSGGGYVGVTGTGTGGNTTGGSQSTGYAFGQGESGNSSSNQRAGAGGGLYGGTTTAWSTGGGGSGYIGNNKLIDKVMYCYKCIESSDIDTKTVSTTSTGEHVSNYANTGNGYAKITLIKEVVKLENEVTYTIPKASKTNYNFHGWYDESGNEITNLNDLNLSNSITLTADYKTPISCSLTLNQDEKTVSINYSDNEINNYGISKNTTPTYNNQKYTISTIDDVGIMYGYVKDKYGNTSSCKINVVGVQYKVTDTFKDITTKDDEKWEFTLNSDNKKIYNHGSLYFHVLSFNLTETVNLLNCKNSDKISVTKSDYYIEGGAEWKCTSSICSGLVYDQTTSYNAKNFCKNKSDEKCIVTLEVNFKKNSSSSSSSSSSGKGYYPAPDKCAEQHGSCSCSYQSSYHYWCTW